MPMLGPETADQARLLRLPRDDGPRSRVELADLLGPPRARLPRRPGRGGAPGQRPGLRRPLTGQSRLLLNAASKAALGASNARRRTNWSASGAPTRRSMPASSHSTEIGPS
ncbi:hypothetical protein GA0070215_120117 [Micromonospora marina]|uniref:Uncharacterized protein n=1 Tax=Micromonospora marina TaxID=307120 RepID=A0A1C4ZUP2_9ACTN|nr:hypothetical protein GA0070215_120117 [Micromonospora marina]